jgi:hypothetical protein
MRIISSIEEPSVIRAILDHLGLWLARARPPPKIHDPPVCLHGTGRSAALSILDDVSQIPAHDDPFYGDPQYSWDDYIEASRIVKKRRAGEVCLNGAQSLSPRRRGMPSRRVTRPKSEPAAQ